MKFNKWTLGLAAVGVVSLASAARADEKMNALQTALSNTTISGYVSASFNLQLSPGGGNAWSGGSPNSPAGYIPFQGETKQDGFNLDVVKLSIAKPQDESPWAAGYQIDLLFGPDAVGYNPSANGAGGQASRVGSIINESPFGSGADFAIKQAYIALRTPVGNGIDWKIGVFDSIIGYEVFDAGSNPNYTRSWGYWMEPTELTGVLASYKINDEWAVSAGIANTLMAGINARNDSSGYADGVGSFWHKAYVASLTYTAPSSWGWAAGSSIYGGIEYGFSNGNYYGGGDVPSDVHHGGNQVNYYAGATMNTPWKQLTTGVAFDYVYNLFGGDIADWANAWDLGLYATFKATDKLSFNARGEYLEGTYYYVGGAESSGGGYNDNAMELTGTVEYDLWANVVSRLEIRWDHFLSSEAGGGQYLAEAVDSVDHQTAVGVYANIIYKF
ncbi:MAG: outer membrane beta-barrel protein [Verrucomicrobiota bacterium]|jgi:hypothetical protein